MGRLCAGQQHRTFDLRVGAHERAFCEDHILTNISAGSDRHATGDDRRSDDDRARFHLAVGGNGDPIAEQVDPCGKIAGDVPFSPRVEIGNEALTQGVPHGLIIGKEIAMGKAVEIEERAWGEVDHARASSGSGSIRLMTTTVWSSSGVVRWEKSATSVKIRSTMAAGSR